MVLLSLLQKCKMSLLRGPVYSLKISTIKNRWPTKILMPFLGFSDYLLQDTEIDFQKKSVDNFEIVHKTCSILVLGTLPPIIINILQNCPQ